MACSGDLSEAIQGRHGRQAIRDLLLTGRARSVVFAMPSCRSVGIRRSVVTSWDEKT